MKNLAVLISMFCIFLFSCKEEEQPAPQDPTAIEYFYPMKVGNYWVYSVIMDLSGTPVVQDTSIDTVRVVGTLTANGLTYYDFRSQFVFEGLFADSAGTIVQYDTLGADMITKIGTTPNTILLQDTLFQGFFYGVIRSGNGDTSITVPRGTFTCLQTVLDAHYLNGEPPAPHSNPRPAYWYYAHNVGLTQMNSWFASTPGDVTVKLLDYHLEQ